MNKTFVGFGFGPIQSALFLLEAYRSGNFSRFVVAEIDPTLVEAVQRNKGTYTVNIARHDGIEQYPVPGIEMDDPQTREGRDRLLEAIAKSDEMATALPSVRFFDAGTDTSVARLLAEGLARRGKPFDSIVYAAENHNHAAELLWKAVGRYAPKSQIEKVQFINTVVGKMSGVISDRRTISQLGLANITPDFPRAILVEEFNRILVSRIRLPGFARGIDVFQEKEDLLPFEEAKLYGHNAIHALIAYLSDLRGLRTIANAADDREIMETARRAFIDESGGALIKRYEKLGDPLFTPEGFQEYAEDLLERMVNPNLNDLVERVGRDHVRKLDYDDRLYGTMHLAVNYGIEPKNLALGAAAGVLCLIRRRSEQTRGEDLPLPKSWEELNKINLHNLLLALWKDKVDRHADRLVALTWDGLQRLKKNGWLL